MMVTFVSQCEKKALNRTRRVLDAFADRIGDSTWQTVITQEGLLAVKKLLRKTASKNTAVSCHWIRSRSRSELVWVVGNRSKFNHRGVVPVNTTQTDHLRLNYENDWQYLPLIKALAATAALLHDWGKATALFQSKLKNASHKGDPIRHEWISCLLLNALVRASDSGSDKGWLNCLLDGHLDEDVLKQLCVENLDKPLHKLPPTAKLIAWLVASHHRLPLPSINTRDLGSQWKGVAAADIDAVLQYITKEWGYENRKDEKDYQKRVDGCFDFPNGLLSQSPKWTKSVKKWAQRLLDLENSVQRVMADGSYRVLLHHARLCLMLGDHYYSSQDAAISWPDTTGLFANTDKKGKFKQKLDEHLFGVQQQAIRTAHLLPAFEQSPPVASDVSVLKSISPKDFRWQDKAVTKIVEWRKHNDSNKQGFFAVNMASTGCGKTFANAKVMRALSDDGESLRYILALGLRTLTLQTGDEYRERIKLDNSELAVLIGSKAVSDLHHQAKAEQTKSERRDSGSESEQPLLDEFVDYDCDLSEDNLKTVLRKEKDRHFLYAPVLACTIDHMMAATETRRGGRYILPSLRLMSSDLVIDEVDDFTGSDLIAIGRLIHLAGMLGRRVMISSATIPPDLAEGYFNAYQQGWQLHAKTRDAVNSVACAWIDEFKTDLEVIPCGDSYGDSSKVNLNYQGLHEKYIKSRVTKLNDQPAKRKAEIIDCPLAGDSGTQEDDSNLFDDARDCDHKTKQEQYFSLIQQAALAKHHQHHTVDNKTAKAVSFGVIRVANISPCVALSKYLLQAQYPDDVDVRVMAYHSQQVLLLRHEQEKHLDRVLKRNKGIDGEPVAFSNSVIRNHLEQSSAKNLLFILVATPVEEVGRDHDFDWAVVEPSSYRSIIQLAGRVRRHRDGEVGHANMAIMQYNWKSFEAGDKDGAKYFFRPGYEEKLAMETHDLNCLLDIGLIAKCLDAVPRIQKKQPLNERHSLVDLEHCVTQSQLTSYQRQGPEALQGYLDQNWYLTAMPQVLNPFRKSEQSTNLFLCYDPERDNCFFAEKDEDGYPFSCQDIHGIKRSEVNEAEKANLWLGRDYFELLERESQRLELDKKWVSLRYGELNLVLREGSEYEYNDQFGLVKTIQEGG